MKKSLKDIPSEEIHNSTVFRKALITTSENKGKIATLNYAWIEKGKQLEIHSHPDGEEYYLFLEGKGEILIGNDWTSVEKGDFVAIPQNKNHSVKNDNNDNLVFITIRTIVSQ